MRGAHLFVSWWSALLSSSSWVWVPLIQALTVSKGNSMTILFKSTTWKLTQPPRTPPPNFLRSWKFHHWLIYICIQLLYSIINNTIYFTWQLFVKCIKHYTNTYIGFYKHFHLLKSYFLLYFHSSSSMDRANFIIPAVTEQATQLQRPGSPLKSRG